MSPLDRAGLVLELPLDRDLRDTSGAGRPPVASRGNVTFVPGPEGGCASFDGSSWLETGLTQQDLGDEFTIECRVCPAERQNPYADLFGNHVDEGLGFVVQQDGGHANEVYAACGLAPQVWAMTESFALTPGRWQHVALVKTRRALRLCVDGVVVGTCPIPDRAGVSPLPIRVGLGYTDPARCYRGLMAQVRFWARALDAFPHARIAPAAQRAVRARVLDASPRPAVTALQRTWTLATDDTRVTLGVTTSGSLAVREISPVAGGPNWVPFPMEVDLAPGVVAEGEQAPSPWVLTEAAQTGDDGQTVTLRFHRESPPMEAVSRWEARQGPGPVRHTLTLTNRSGKPLVLAALPVFDLDLAGAAVLWNFHTDGGTPDARGVYRRTLAEEAQSGPRAIRTSPLGEFVPFLVLDAGGRHTLYLGLEWGFCRIETVVLPAEGESALRVRAGAADRRLELAPGESVAAPPGFIGTCPGDVDDAGNRLRRWMFRYMLPLPLRDDPGYPKVQWNAFGATGKTPGSWDPVESKYYPFVDEAAALGFEEIMIDVGWWEGAEPDPDPADWPSGMRKAAEYAHSRGLRFGLYWSDDLDMADPAARARRATRIRRLFEEHRADMWRSDNTRGTLVGLSYGATRGFYEMLDGLARGIPGFQWEDCCSGGRVKDYGALRRTVKVFNSDTYSALHVRQAFHDSSYALHPVQIEGHLGSTDGRLKPRGAAAIRFAFRSMSMGAPEWFLDAPGGGNGTEPWTEEEKTVLRECVELYKTRIRPLIRSADLYHILPRPDGLHWDGIEYWDPAAGRGVVYLFKPGGGEASQAIPLRGLDPQASYRVTFADGTNPGLVATGAELAADGVSVALPAGEVSELIFLEAVR